MEKTAIHSNKPHWKRAQLNAGMSPERNLLLQERLNWRAKIYTKSIPKAKMVWNYKSAEGNITPSKTPRL